MKKTVLFHMESPYRDPMRITAYEFGEGEKSCAVVGAMRGNEAQQIYSCARLVAVLKKMEEEGRLCPGKKVTVIPAVNNYSVNTGRRFWPLDNTDINRMFPGYDKGETTQRIAWHVFEYVKAYSYGIQLASYYMPGQFVPHIRMMQTGYEAPEAAAMFGFPFIYVRQPKPYDTTTLNYNWQVWGCRAFSLFAGKNEEISEEAADMTVSAIRRFLVSAGICRGEADEAPPSRVVRSGDMRPVTVSAGGLLRQVKKAGEAVAQGELLGEVVHPLEGTLAEALYAPVDGRVFYINANPFVFENTTVYRILRD